MPCNICGQAGVSHQMMTIDRDFVGYMCSTCYRGLARDPYFERTSCKYCSEKATYGVTDNEQGDWEPLVCDQHYEELTSYHPPKWSV